MIWTAHAVRIRHVRNDTTKITIFVIKIKAGMLEIQLKDDKNPIILVEEQTVFRAEGMTLY